MTHLFCPDCRSHHEGNCPAQPKITFTKCQTRAAFDAVVSRDNTVRFRTIKRNGVVTIDADWFATPWTLTKPAIDKIFEYCSEVMSVGGGETSIRVRVKPQMADSVAAFVAKIVASEGAWQPISAPRSKYSKASFDETGEAA